jgi:hypothetical protein
MKNKSGKTTVFLAAAVYTLSCSWLGQFLLSQAGPAAPAAMLTQYAAPDTGNVNCNASSELKIMSEITEDKLNEFGTRDCEYNLVIWNEKSANPVWIFGYRHTTDVYQDLDEYEWVILGKRGYQEETLFGGYYSYSIDPEAMGSISFELEKYAGIVDSPECEKYKNDEEYLDGIAITIPRICK